jgi:hypothetical protein
MACPVLSNKIVPKSLEAVLIPIPVGAGGVIRLVGEVGEVGEVERLVGVGCGAEVVGAGSASEPLPQAVSSRPQTAIAATMRIRAPTYDVLDWSDRSLHWTARAVPVIGS